MGRFRVTSLRTGRTVGRLLLWGGLGLILLSGCGRGTFVARQYDDFTAYYNKFYNAEQAFDKGREALREEERTIDRTEYLAVFPVPTSKGNESAFEKAIQKGSDVLRDHPDSRWVDEALLLIGKSYFYQGNYVGALQKFREVISLEEGQKDEARFWLARTLVAGTRFEEATEIVQRRTEAAAENTWTARMHLVQGELFARRKQWKKAATSLERGLEGDVPNEAGARAAFLLGQVHQTRGAPGEARAAYRRVHDYDPPYEIEFAARLSAIELQGQYGNAAVALERLEDLQTDDKNLDKRGEMALVEARIHRAQGRPDQAQSVLKRVLYGDTSDPSLSQTAKRRLHYELAVLYREAYEDFSRAAAHFDTASTAQQQRTGAEGGIETRLPTAPTDAASLSKQYSSLADRADTVARLDSLLRIGRLSESEFRAFVAKQRRKQRAEQRRKADAASGPQRIQARGDAAAVRQQTENKAAETRDSEAGFLFYEDPDRVQEGQRRFVEVWGDRPLVDNWRRRNAMSSAQADEEQTAETQRETETAQSDPGLNLSAIPRDSSSRAEMQAERARARYEFGNSLFLAAGRPDSAAVWYRRVLEEDGEHPVARRALYALAEAYWEQGDTTAAQQAYERLIRQYPSSDLTVRARQRLSRGGAQSGEQRSVSADSMYARAYRGWEQGAWRSSLKNLLDVARRYPDTEAAPRALLASGILYWRRLQADSTSGLVQPIEQYLVEEGADSTSMSRPDSLAARTNGADGAPDSTGNRISVLRAPTTDSSTTRSAQDTVAADSGRVEADRSSPSTAVRPDSAGADTTAADPRRNPFRPLQELLRHLADRYAETPQRKRAESILALIETAPSSPDSVSVGYLERAKTASESAPDTLEEAEPKKESSPSASPSPAQDDSARRQRQTGDADPLPAPRSVRSSTKTAANWTVHVQSFSTADAAEERRQDLQTELGEAWTVDVVRDPAAASPYLLVVGQFETKKDARTARTQLRKKLDDRLAVRKRPRASGDP